MNALETLFISVADASWRAGCAILLVLVAHTVLRSRVPSRLLFWVWLALALRLLLPLSLPVAWSPFHFAPWKSATSDVAAPVPTPSPARGSASRSPDPETAAASSSMPAASLPFTALEATALVWLGGVAALLLARGIASLAFARRLRRTAQPIPADALPPEAAQFLAARGVPAFVTAAVVAPALHGVFRPRILFPPDFIGRLTPAELGHVLDHELAHAQRRDLLADALLHLAAVVHWFNPLAWLAVRLARRECELACDETVVRRATDTARADYGATLLRIASLTRSTPRPAPGLGVVDSKSHLKRRIQMLVTRPASSVAGTLLGAAAFALLIGLSFTSETTAQVTPAPAVTTIAPAPAAAVGDNTGILYNPSIDRLDHLFPTGVVATVNDRAITVADVRNYIAPLIPQLKREVRTQEEFNGRLDLLQNSAIKDLVNRAVLIRQFHDQRDGEPPRTIAAEYVDKAIADEIARRFGGDRARFLDYLRSRNQTQREYRNQVEEDIIHNYMRSQERKLTGASTPVRKPAENPADKPIRLRIIQLTRTAGETDASLLEKAGTILARFRNGESFEQLAREFDQSKRQARGGDWGWIGADDLKPNFRDTVFALQKGEASAPLLLPEGGYILYVDDRR